MILYQNLAFLITLLLTSSCQTSRVNQTEDSKQHPAQTKIDIHSQNGDNLRLAYIGNMGILAESGDRTVLFDGLHEKYKPAYVYPSEGMVDQLIKGSYTSFSPVEIILTTHPHGDHFSAQLSADFLSENQNAIQIGSGQIKKAIAQKRIDVESAVLLAPYQKQITTFKHKDIEVKAIRCDHVNPSRHGQIENMAYLVQMDRYSILHIGDTDWDLAEPYLEQLLAELGDKPLDIAILPYWMLLWDDAEERIEKVIHARKIIATHLPPEVPADQHIQIKKAFPEAQLFVEIGEEFSYY